MWSVCRFVVVTFEAFPECVHTQLRKAANDTKTNRHTDHIILRYMMNYTTIRLSCNSQGLRKLPEDGTRMPKHVGARISNKQIDITQCTLLVIMRNIAMHGITIRVGFTLYTRPRGPLGRVEV